jgi:hypothetical protein
MIWVGVIGFQSIRVFHTLVGIFADLVSVNHLKQKMGRFYVPIKMFSRFVLFVFGGYVFTVFGSVFE